MPCARLRRALLVNASSMSSFVLVVAAVVPLASSGCASSSGTPDEQCVNVSLDCRPIVSPPTFDAIYTNIIATSCASATGRCHGVAASGGLDMSTADRAFAGLSSRSRPDSPGCSLVLERLESTVTTYRMPPGPMPLSEAQRCAIRQWIGNGAKR